MASITIDSVRVPTPVIIYKYDTVTVSVNVPYKVLVTDTFTSVIRLTDSITVPLNIDTNRYIIRLAPAAGDSYPELQAAINFQQANGGYKILLSPGTFYISHPLLVTNIISGQYWASYINMEGASNAKNPIQGQISKIIPLFDSGFAIGMQQCKGCMIKNVLIQGRYTFPNSLTEIQIDTLPYAGWNDGIHSFNKSSPYAGIVIDPFSDPINYDGVINKEYPGMSQYYLPGMNISGSTAVNISGIYIQDFVVGMCVTPSHQLNGEMINLTDSHLDNNCIDYAFTQAQAKVNLVTDLETWGQGYCIFDGNRFGINGGDGSICPMIDEVNIAGFVHEFISDYSNSFPVSIKRVYAEGLFKFGTLYSQFGAHLDDCQMDFQLSDPSVPSPGVIFAGSNTTFTGCMFRVYDASPLYNRLPFFGSTLNFIGGAFGGPPVMGQLGGFGPNSPFNPHFNGVLFPYTSNSGFSGLIDSFNNPVQIGSFLVRVNRSNFSGYVTGYQGSGVSPGDLLVASLYTDDVIPTLVDDYSVGFVASIGHDTIYLSHVGFQIQDSVSYSITDVVENQTK